MSSAFRRIFALAAVGLVAAACEDPVEPPVGEVSDIQIRAFVDSDASESFTAADDQAIASLAVTLTNTEDTTDVLSAQTDAEGLVTFEDVVAGSYEVSWDTTAVPEGTALDSLTSPIISPFEGSAEPITGVIRFLLQPGSVSGIVFDDENGNGTFDDGTDETVSGMTVELYAGTDISGEAAETATTDSAGVYEFSPLNPGEFTVVLRSTDAYAVVGDSAKQVTVAAEAEATANFEVEPSILTIGEARALISSESDTANARVIGVVTVATGPFGGSNFFIQDATGGILGYLGGAEGDTDLAVGDSVVVVGDIYFYFGEKEVDASSVEILGQGTVPDAQAATVAEINAGDFQGELVVVDSITVDSVEITNSFGTQKVWALNAEGDTLTLYVDNRTGIDSTYWSVGTTYTVAGVASMRDGGPVLKPRAPQDLQIVSAPTGTVDIQMARLYPEGTAVTVVGVVNAGQGTYRDDNFYVQDETGGILVFGADTALALAVGDSVEVAGTIDSFNGEMEIVSPTITALGAGTTPVAATVDIADLNAGLYQGELVELEGVTVEAVDGSNVTISDGSDTLLVYIDSDTGITVADAFTVGSTYNITGIASMFFDPQLKPRSSADIELVS